MKKQITITLIIGLSLIILTNTYKFKSKLKVNGDWEFKKIKIEGKEKNASELNNCGYNDILQIRRKKQNVEYEYEGVKIKGNQIGVSNKKNCTISPIVHKYVIANNSCPTNWIRISNAENRIVSVSEGLVIEYEISKPNCRTMILTRIREITNYGISTPEEIRLKKIKIKD